MKRLSVAFLLVACNGGASIGTDTADDGANGAEVPLRDPDETEHHDLASGDVMEDLDWMSTGSTACVPGTETTNYNGAHVILTFVQDKMEDFYVQAVPDEDVDVSLYVMQVDQDETWLPPDIGGGLVTCDESLDYDDEGFGNLEAVYESGYPGMGEDSYRVIVGIAGANHQDDGGFDVNVWRQSLE